MKEIGEVNIDIIRGNNKVYNLSFFDLLPDGSEVPINLSLYSSIKMDIKLNNLIQTTIFKSLVIGSGLSITGVNSNILSIQFDRDFVTVNTIQFQYDILFVKAGNFETLIKGLIDIESVVTL